MATSEVETKDIIALHNQGLSPSEIAAKLGTTYEVVAGRLIRAGFEPHPLLPAVPTEEIVALHKQGLSPTEIAARVNLSHQAIRGRLLRAGFKPVLSLKLVRAAERASDIVRLHQEGLTPKHIAERLGLKWGLVHKYLREARLAPNPSEEETRNALQGADEILRLAKGDIPRYEIAKRIGSTWPLVAETLERFSTKSVWPACDELSTWASRLLPIVDEIRNSHPNTGAILRKVEQLEKELVAISDAIWIVQHRLPWTGKEADEERWCVADISQVCSSSLDYIEALKGCVKQLDVAKLPKVVDQAVTCITNICSVISGAMYQVVEKPKEVASVGSMGAPSEMYQSETPNDHELLLNFSVEEFCSPGLVLSETRAKASPCSCFTYKDKDMCWSKGILGLLTQPQQDIYCVAGKAYKAQPALTRRYETFAAAAEEAHKKIESMPKGMPRLEAWLSAMGEELSKKGIEV